MDGKRPSVSEAHLEVTQPRSRKAPAWLLLLAMAALVAASTSIVWFVILPQRKAPRQTGADVQQVHVPFHDRESRADRTGALEHMQKIADAMVRYRDTQGGGMRWPHSLDELRLAGLLDQDFRLNGRMSGQSLVYNPDMPLGHDPERWVMVHDIELGWVRSRGGYSPSRGIRSAAVILGDGTARLIEGSEVEYFAGLNLGPEAAR